MVHEYKKDETYEESLARHATLCAQDKHVFGGQSGVRCIWCGAYQQPHLGAAEPPAYITVKATARSRSYLAEFHLDPAVSRERGVASWWLVVRNGAHRVGCFARPQVEQMLSNHRDQGHLIASREAGRDGS